MKKIINGKRYDTDTAKKIAFWTTGGSMSDFRYAEEDLYRKKTGEFFVHGQGHSMTRWGVSQDKTMHDSKPIGWGEDLQPLTEPEARLWVERYCNSEYEPIFGKCEE